MDALRRVSEGAKKGFISKRNDRFRPPWGKHTVNFPRQCTFAGTINPEAGGYLTDATGARRCWPFRCYGDIDLDGLKQVRDQLFAEAVYLFKANHPWHLETPDLEKLAQAQQDARFKADILEQPIREWLEGREAVGVTDIMVAFFGPEKFSDQKLQNRVQKIITKNGYTEPYRPRTPDGECPRPRMYRKPPDIKKPLN
jgi:predicted P-loop ATPase